jgi:cytochrome c oxidase assembly protein subunit 15
MNTETIEQQNNRQIALWLLVICALIFTMVVLGGVTRLTRSGLSMVEWDPIMGIVPPLNEQEWNETFEKYKQYPEYQKINAGMSLHEFKSIFYFEYGHRVLGRTIGLAFLLPFLYFLFRGRIRRSLRPKLVIMFVLGGMQGLLGWYMVKSGLVDKPHVSQYRLTAHLAAAIAIYGYILWVALGLLHTRAENTAVDGFKQLRKYALAVTTLVIIMILSGGLVAGTKAGFAYNTFPLMGDQFFPSGMFMLEPWYMNFFDNIVSVQFNHRMIAYLLCILIPVFWFMQRRFSITTRSRMVITALLVMLIIQVGLGISTLLLHVPVWLGATHQAGALVLFTIALMVNHELRKRDSNL